MTSIQLTESQVHDILINNDITRSGLKEILNIGSDLELILEDEYQNGIIADFTVIDSNRIKSIIEVKGSNINLTDYVRGLGQLFQYHGFYLTKVPHKSFVYHENFNTVYLVPSSVFINNQFNVGTFTYPESTIIIEMNEYNHTLRRISDLELNAIKQTKDSNLITISPYYFRDNRVFEYYILLKILSIFDDFGAKACNRRLIEGNVLSKFLVINNGNWRNAFITLSSLGLINSNNMPTKSGKRLVSNSYEEFAVEMYYSYIEPYSREILRCFNTSTINKSNNSFSNEIRKRFNEKDVLFLTQSNNRYISSWMNILRDDYGIISFEARQNLRTKNFDPSELNTLAFREKVRKYSIASKYIEEFQVKFREVKIYEVFDF